MKKLSLKSKILLSAILLGGGIAGAHTLSNAPSAQESRYNWKASNDAPENPGQQLNNQTVSQAEDHFGCDGATNLCATGTKVSGSGPTTQIINYD